MSAERLSLASLLIGLTLLLSIPEASGSEPARRILALSPHTVELVYAAGAGDRLVGRVAHSDHPPAARALPEVGDSSRLDRERILALKPDLAVAWTSGNRARDLAWLEEQGIRVYRSDPLHLEEIADQIEDLGDLAGTTAAAQASARLFRSRLQDLRRRFASGREVRVFYQLWPQPLMTVDGRHLISKVLALCGGRNIFPQLPASTTVVDSEAVIAADPEVIVAAKNPGDPYDPLQRWRDWDRLKATRRGHLLTISADLLHRPTPRILAGAEQLCAELAEIRRSTSEAR